MKTYVYFLSCLFLYDPVQYHPLTHAQFFWILSFFQRFGLKFSFFYLYNFFVYFWFFCFPLLFFLSYHLTYSLILLSLFAFLFLRLHFSLLLSSFLSLPLFRSLLRNVFVTQFTPEQFLYACVIHVQLQIKRKPWTMNLEGKKVDF